MGASLGAPVPEGWRGLFCEVLKGRAAVKASQFSYCVMFSTGSGVSSERRSCGVSRLLMQRAALPTQT